MNDAAPSPRPLPVLRYAPVAVLIFAVALRVALSWINTEANDDHLVVMREIRARNWSSPGRDVAWECYHAKLYHYVSAAAYAVLGLPATRTHAWVANAVAAAAGFGMLALIFLLAKEREESVRSPATRLTALTFFALWPALIVISSQATNDSFVITFGSFSLYFLHSFMRHQRARDALLSTGFMILAVSSKASGWCFFFAAMIVVAVKTLVDQGPRVRRFGLFFIGSAVSFLLVACLQQPYRGYIREYGTPFKIAPQVERTARPFPHFFERTFHDKPGVISVADSYFTFRLWNMMADPYIDNGEAPAPPHRTSFWSQIYGRTFSARFDQWPPGWQSDRPLVRNTTRLCLVAGLLPAFTFLTGFWLSFGKLISGVRREGSSFLARNHDWILPVFLLSFVAMVVYLTAVYRNYSFMKVIYFLPVTPALFACYADGLDHWTSRVPWLGRLCRVGSLVLVVLFVFETMVLIRDLVLSA
jgi:hypothetical protein